MNSSSRRTFLFTGLALPQAAKKALAPKDPPVRFRTLGKTGLKVSEVGYGSETVSDPSVFARSLDLGINFFDTARSYQHGNSERSLGQALAGKRKNVVLSSRSYGKDAATIQRELDESLKALGTDYLDFWYIGNKDKAADVTPEMLEVQRKAQKAGKIRFRAFSTHRLHNNVQFILDNQFDLIQVPYNFAIGTRRDSMGMDGANLEQAMDRLHKAGVGLVAMKVMAGGYRGRTTSDPLYGVYQRGGSHVAAIRWALRRPAICSTSVNMQDHDQLIEDVKAMEAPYSDGDEKLLAGRTDQLKGVLCRFCGACDGACPKGLPTADLVRFVTYADGYGRLDVATARFHQLPQELQQVRCGDCQDCPVHCPNGVKVRQQLTRAQTLLA